MARIHPITLNIINTQDTMTNQNKDLPPLKNIEQSGTYTMKLTRPKDDKLYERFKKNKKGFASCRLFFIDENGNCMTKNFSVEYGKGLALLVGKMTGQFVKEPSQQMSVEQLIKFVEPAFGKKAVIELEVTPDKEWNGKMQFNYKLGKITSLGVGAPYAPKAQEDVPERFTTEEPPF